MDVIIDDTHLKNIAEAIREKTISDTTYKPREMAEAIESIKTPPQEAFEIIGDCEKRFTNWGWFIDLCGDKITTKYLSNLRCAFRDCEAISIPFTINQMEYEQVDWTQAFYSAENLEYIAPIPLMKTTNSLNLMWCGCHNLIELPQITKLDLSGYQDYLYKMSNHLMFGSCYSLRRIPEQWIKELRYTNCRGNGNDYSTGSYTYMMCSNDYCLDEIIDLFPPGAGLDNFSITDNLFIQMLDYCYRLRNFTFAVQPDGTPYKMKWAKQCIDLTTVGYEPTSTHTDAILTYGRKSGITEETCMTDINSYERLINHPDSWSRIPEYSRYNHDSAVRTINSLPDTADFVESTGIGNTIIFTPAGNVGMLTEEEVAVAAEKGWTVSYG